MVYEVSANDGSNYNNYDNFQTSAPINANSSEITPEEIAIYESKLEELKKDLGYLSDARNALDGEIGALENEKNALISERDIEYKKLLEDYQNDPNDERLNTYQTKLEELNNKYEQKLEPIQTEINSKTQELRKLQLRFNDKLAEFKSTYEDFLKRMPGKD